MAKTIAVWGAPGVGKTTLATKLAEVIHDRRHSTAVVLYADMDKTICLAVSPALKAIGVPSRPRLFEAKQAIALYEAANHTKVDYIVATPRMAEYIRVSSKIYEVFLRYISEDDIHV